MLMLVVVEVFLGRMRRLGGHWHFHQHLLFWVFASTTNALALPSVTWSSLRHVMTVCRAQGDDGRWRLVLWDIQKSVGQNVTPSSASARRSFIVIFFFFDRVDSECTPSWMCLCFSNAHHGLVLHSLEKKTPNCKRFCTLEIFPSTT